MTGLEIDVAVDRPAFRVAAAFGAAAGSPVALVGPNGAGKSTVLAAVAGLEPLAAGRVRLGGRDLTGLPTERRRLGVVFQDFLLFPHLDVRDNVAFPIRVAGASRAAARRRAAPWLERFGLAGLAGRHPFELSGGQRQRVALARALAAEPEALLLDEPMASLDVEGRDEIRAELAAHVRGFGGPTVVVTHDREDAAALADRVVVLEGGRVVQDGALDELATAPATPWVARFAG
jgi:molybdate transport system ATP-binding protein